MTEMTYIGNHPDIKLKSGEAYEKDGEWFFRPYDSEEWYRVKAANLKKEST